MKRKATDTDLYQWAKRRGCKPEWSNGIFGPAWRCTCKGNDHGCDQQCSDIYPRTEQEWDDLYASLN